MQSRCAKFLLLILKVGPTMHENMMQTKVKCVLFWIIIVIVQFFLQFFAVWEMIGDM